MRSPTSRIPCERSGNRPTKQRPSASTSTCVRSRRRNGDGAATRSFNNSAGSGDCRSAAMLRLDPTMPLRSGSRPRINERNSSRAVTTPSLHLRTCLRCSGLRLAEISSTARLAPRPKRVEAKRPGRRKLGPRRYSSAQLSTPQASRYTLVATSPTCQTSGTVASRSISARRRSTAFRTVGCGLRHQS